MRRGKRRRRERLGGAVTQPGWLLTYSDMVTLCLAFFVLLYSYSSLDTQKFKSLVISLQGALGFGGVDASLIDGFPGEKLVMEETEPTTLNKEQMDSFLQYEQETKKLEAIQASLNRYLQEKGLESTVTINMEERGLVLRFQDSVLFAKSRSELIGDSTAILTHVGEILQGVDNPIRIEGHTDNLPIKTVQFPSNWELSTSRATNVLRYLVEKGIASYRLSAVGYGEFHPVAPNDSEANRSKNRRVDIVVIRGSERVNEPH